MHQEPDEVRGWLDDLRRGDKDALARLVEYYRARLQRSVGLWMDPALRTRVDPSDVVQDEDFSGTHPDGSPLGALAAQGAVITGRLGDYRIVREIGRGGMGIVFEAQQVSLGRRVALKTLPLAGTLDPRQLQRFKNEAQAVAALGHPNIVGILSVGCASGVHYYAMHYVEGWNLSQLIGQLRQLSKQAEPGSERSDLNLLTEQLLSAELIQHSAPNSKSPHLDPLPKGEGEKRADPLPKGEEATVSTTCSSSVAPHPSSLPTEAQAALSTQGSPGTSEFFRSVAGLGIQAAEALEHAHHLGVVHRDIKPSNLMVDLHAHLWITDFGLAVSQEDGTVTRSGDIVGTFRYMSPEQTQGNRRLIDHRTDIYSLGVTLYELLTLQPAFAGADRQEMLRQIAEKEPRAPRQVNPAIPRDLETIVLKAMAKEPSSRYATAQHLAADLKRFLDDEPIQARRPTLADRTAKWARRHRPLVWSAAAFLGVTMIGLLMSTLLIAREQQRTAHAYAREEPAVDRHRARGAPGQTPGAVRATAGTTGARAAARGAGPEGRGGSPARGGRAPARRRRAQSLPGLPAPVPTRLGARADRPIAEHARRHHPAAMPHRPARMGVVLLLLALPKQSRSALRPPRERSRVGLEPGQSADCGCGRHRGGHDLGRNRAEEDLHAAPAVLESVFSMLGS